MVCFFLSKAYRVGVMSLLNQTFVTGGRRLDSSV
jgi:hypothetical protein